jgi:RNA polymerase sigma factor (sigma-70 family)
MLSPTKISDPVRRAAPVLAPSSLPQDFETWFREHRTAVFRYVRFRVATREAAEDVTSEVFMKALRSFDRYDENRASPRTWLLRIARNAITDHLRAL